MSEPLDPPWLSVARKYIGVREVNGPKHSAVIMGWIKALGSKLGISVQDDETPWCGTFMAEVMTEAGLPTPPFAVRASSWSLYGRGLLAPRWGCILVFTRSGGGHVGLYVGEDDKYYRVLGGNQSDSVSYTWIAKGRCSAIRWPNGAELPAAKSVYVDRTGRPTEKISTNEA